MIAAWTSPPPPPVIDYRLPVAYRWLGLLELAPDLATRIAEGRVFAAHDSAKVADEHALRLGTALCFRHLLAVMPTISPARLDLLLWAGSRQAQGIPAHRFETLSY